MADIAWHPSPNFGARRDGGSPRLIVIHYTAMASAGDAIARLCDPAYEVSAHYVIAKSGGVTQLVRDADRAWHAGAGSWAGGTDINSHSIGIELDNDGAAPFSAPLMDALEGLIKDLMQRHGIDAQDVIGHSDLAPTRKIDPGPRFDWRRLARGGYAVWHDSPPDADRLTKIGYDVAQFGLAACRAAYAVRFGHGKGIDRAAPSA